MRQLKAQKEAPKTSSRSKVEEISKDSKKKSDATKTEKEELKNKDSKQTSSKIHENEEENKPCPMLRSTMDDMVEMMSKCLENVKIIESKWKKSKYSSVGTDRARHHVLKQLEAMKINFESLGKDLLESSVNEAVKTEDIEKEHNEMEQSDKKVRKARCSDDKNQDKNVTEEKSSSEESICQGGKLSIKNDESSSKSDNFEKGVKVPGDKGIEGQDDALQTETDKEVGMEVAPGDFADHGDAYEVGSEHSSKACLPSDEEHSLPELMDVIKDIISDHEEPMDTETNSAEIKPVDAENDTPKLSEVVVQKQKAGGKNEDNRVTADCTDEEGDKEASDHESYQIRRRKNAIDDSKSDSDAAKDEKALQKTSHQVKRRRFTRASENDDLSDSRSTNRKRGNGGKNEVVDGKDDVETSRVDKDDKKDIDTGRGGLSISMEGQEQELGSKNIGENQKKLKLNHIDDTELKNAADFDLKKSHGSPQQDSGQKVNGDSDDNNEEEDLSRVVKDQVQSDKILDSKNEEVETDKQENKRNKNGGKRNERSRGSDVSDMEEEEGSRSGRESDRSRECEESSKVERDCSSKDTVVQKKKKGSVQNNGLSKRSKNDQKKEESNMDSNAGKHRKTRRGKQRRCSETVEDDRFLGLVEGSETSEEENTDDEIQRRREDHTEKRRDKKKKIEKRRSFESEDKSEKKESISSEEKTIKVMNGKDKAENEDEKERNEWKEGMDSQEEEKENKTEEQEALSCTIDNDADTKNEKNIKVKKDCTIKEECDVKLKDNKESISCDRELPVKEEEKKTSQKKKVHPKTENQIAKAAILESESDVELEDKPKPRSKKKHIRRLVDPQNKRRCYRKLHLAMTEEEQEELKGKQLNGKCHVLVKSLSSKVQKDLEVHEYIYASDFPEFEYPSVKKHGFDSDGCDADEEDSDKEFSKLMK